MSMLILLFPLFIQDDPIPALIEKLGSDSIEERERATAALAARVDDAQEELERAIESADPEVSARARRILETPTPYRREVRGEMAHLFDHALWSFQKRRAGECAALCDAMLLVDPRFRLALELRESLRQGFAADTIAGDFSTLRCPPRRSWEAIRRRIRETVLSGIDTPDDGSRCPIAVRNRLQALTIDLEFENAKIEDVLQLIHDLTGLNLILDARVESMGDMDRTITFRARGRSVGESLRQILAEAGEEYVVTGEGVVLIRPPRWPDFPSLDERDPERY